MRILHKHHAHPSDPGQRGAALLLSFLVLIVILMICYQVNRTVSGNQTEANRNRILTSMEWGIDSILLQIHEDLKADAEGGGAGAGAAPADPLDAGLDGAEGGEESSDPVDSKMDDWATPDTVHINDQALRILIVDEDSKFNVLGILNQNEDEAEEALDILRRVLDFCREDTAHDIDSSQAAEMAQAILTHLKSRKDSLLPMEERLSDPEDEQADTARMPTSLREFIVLEPFEEHHFKDFFDVDGNRVHSIEWFLTCYTTVTTKSGAASGGGFAVNVNTAPRAVLAALFDSREVDGRLWAEVIEYRNTEDEETSESDEDVEPMLDEFGNEVLQMKFFDNLEELEELRNFEGMEEETKALIRRRLVTTSQVFTIYVVARQSTRSESNQIVEFSSQRERELYERDGTHLLKIVRSVVWRQSNNESASIIPLIRWDVLDHAPLEVLDIDDN
tara:strand:- start:405 stop:1748 length:1344 start_codon:yes stop_codon:yes gene_type:complete